LYGRNTDDDEVQWSKELIMMGRRTGKINVQRLTFAIATKRSLAKASIDPGGLKVMGTDRGENAMNDFMKKFPNNLAHTFT
jgi:hypothetical protein